MSQTIIGHSLKELREKKGLNYKQLAEKSGVNARTISKIEKHNFKNVNTTHIRLLVKCLGQIFTDLYEA
ncbi:MAG: XRE family transcriptional regulator [Firmicutes bacterium HGW-Firmicutes-19]|jgi:transcriptional regulator with XRE-family HTH domain|nr:MAG: XRE family transcriptional regulator [Firmicutes bacterium HGW-Firmicutes-19]